VAKPFLTVALYHAKTGALAAAVALNATFFEAPAMAAAVAAQQGRVEAGVALVAYARLARSMKLAEAAVTEVPDRADYLAADEFQALDEID
jgi:Flp pilus assembly protein CpaB